ncbi:MAG: ATP phosphoribosyltransferase regulatory subunit [Chloroflexi bacterium]|nr:MAG: ATP phosphoribosyltransferase regulatory subunit [Chloroflexota bacterium]
MQDASTVAGAGAPRGRAGGFTDWLPGAAERRRAVGDAFLDTFGAWGYGLVSTPLIEPVDTVAAGVGGASQTRLFRFMDADGSLLALVGERTVSVARVVATQLRDGPFPLRLCYLGPVLRNAALLGGRRRELLQAGCELIGTPELAADAECVALAAEALGRAGLDGVQIDVGHADFLPGLLESAEVDDATRERVLAALSGRDLVAVEAALAATPVGNAERSLLLRFPALRGGREILEAAAQDLRAPRALRALEQLGDLWDLLGAHGFAGAVHLDLGAVRDWEYYTGPTFELFSGDLGFPLGTGGRYDTLLGRFGLATPATGFVLHLDRCCDALARRGLASGGFSVLVVGHVAGEAAAAIALATRLRRAGLPARRELRACAEDADVDVLVRGAGRVVWKGAGGRREVSIDDLLSQLTVGGYGNGVFGTRDAADVGAQ